ncbi:MAG: DUF839 domain-containing protein [Cyanobacteria bacterium J007]|nr:MAG: DUF839 domain-containing protein [Cyanobacteria bacterium J007]
MTLKRRHFLMFIGAGLGAAACTSIAQKQQSTPRSPSTATFNTAFKPLQGPFPLDGDPRSSAAQIEAYSRYRLADDLILPEGYGYYTIAAWGDPLGDSRFGYNNDYLSFIAVGDNEGWLTVNFEYISGGTWRQTYPIAIGRSLPFEEVATALKSREGKIDAGKLPDKDPLKAKIREICEAALEDQGIGVVRLRKSNNGEWKLADSPANRRISGISGLKGRYLNATGPGVAIFKKAKKRGFEDGLGDRIVGTFGNCAGGTSPWGTVFSAEENFQAQVPESVYPDGSSFDPSNLPFHIGGLYGQGNVFRLAGNKYGYMVEVDPSNPEDYGTKHTWLGRYRHEAVGFKVVAGQPLALYSGCDRRGGHLYKFVSKGTVRDPKDKANSQLLAEGMLYTAIFEPGGSGRWIPLKAETAIDPVLPSHLGGAKVRLPKRPDGGTFEVASDREAIAFKQQFKTLGDLYEGNAIEKQGAILIDAHYAANAVGGTACARPEDLETDSEGRLYIAYTSGSADGQGGPDLRIFRGPDGEPWEYGWIMRLRETDDDPAATSFEWEMLAMGGEPDAGGAGFSNPDNVLIDGDRNVWMVTDISTDKQNKPDGADRRGCFGNNSVWLIPTRGEDAGNAYLFATGPMECEICGPFLTQNRETLFLAVQHPGEMNGIREGDRTETRKFTLKTTDGTSFVQTREVPIGSNWPDPGTQKPPKPAIVAVRRLDGGAIV